MDDLAGAPETTWSNWSGLQTASPARIGTPEDVDALRALLSGPRPVRPVGAGHSFTPLARTEGTLVSLDRIAGVLEADTQAKTARVGAGARLRDLSPALEARGLAFKNLGDIDVQSVAGAMATATHGTGAGFPCLSAELIGGKLLTASGELVEFGQGDPLLPAAQVSLGALGVLVEAELSLRSAYRLHRRAGPEPIGDILAAAEARWARHRNFEFFYIPFSDHGIAVVHDETEAAETPREEADDDAAVMGLKAIRDDVPDPAARREILSRAMAGSASEDVVGVSWKLLASQRGVPFNEMEYHLPPDGALDVFGEVAALIEAERPDVFFPIEVRKTAGDDALLSPFTGGPRISIAVHAYAEDDHAWMVEAVEPIFRAAGGRPHWGKLHSLGAEALAALYPDFERFRALRRELDPDGVFLNAHLEGLFEPHA